MIAYFVVLDVVGGFRQATGIYLFYFHGWIEILRKEMLLLQ